MNLGYLQHRAKDYVLNKLAWLITHIYMILEKAPTPVTKAVDKALTVASERIAGATEEQRLDNKRMVLAIIAEIGAPIPIGGGEYLDAIPAQVISKMAGIFIEEELHRVPEALSFEELRAAVKAMVFSRMLDTRLFVADAEYKDVGKLWDDPHVKLNKGLLLGTLGRNRNSLHSVRSLMIDNWPLRERAENELRQQMGL